MIKCAIIIITAGAYASMLLRFNGGGRAAICCCDIGRLDLADQPCRISAAMPNGFAVVNDDPSVWWVTVYILPSYRNISIMGSGILHLLPSAMMQKHVRPTVAKLQSECHFE